MTVAPGPPMRARPASRYATREEALSTSFLDINRVLDRLNVEYGLPDHAELNRFRYPWARVLSQPEFYASRLWEYPWALLEGDLRPGLVCADVGCGMSPFILYLSQIAQCRVIGFDPDFPASGRYYCHAVTLEFAQRSGIEFVAAPAEALEASDAMFDRVFCISVIEHIPRRKEREDAMHEIARVLRPGGLAVISCDVNLKSRMVNPLELAWESGLELVGGIDTVMPVERFGNFNDGLQPADVFGLVLRKPDQLIKTDYGLPEADVEAWRVAYLRDTLRPEWPEDYSYRTSSDSEHPS